MDKMAKILLVFLCICLFACTIPAMAANETSGKCGRNVTWNFDEQTHTLTISGTGEMNNDRFGHEMRWAHLYDKIRYIVIEDGITSICDYAFEGSTELKEVTIPESVTYIGESAFERSSLRHIDLHDGITYIGNSAFEWSRLEEVTVPAGVKELSFGVFRRCRKLKSVVLPEGLTTIHGDAFTDCTALESIVIPDSVTVMKDAFQRCSALTEITLSQNTKVIYSYCFQFCTALREIRIPDSVTFIYNEAFLNCISLEKVTLGTGVGDISPSAFRGCKSLKSYVVSEENKTFANDEHGVIYSKDGSRLELIPTGFAGEYTVAQGTRIICAEAGYDCRGLVGLVIPDSVTEIERNAFMYCVNLKTLQLSNGLQIIRADAFQLCESLEILIIPASVTYLANGAFGACSALRIIEFLGDCPRSDNYVFGGFKTDAWYPEGNATWVNNFPDDAYFITWHPGCAGTHSFVEDAGTPPTCAEEGTTASTYCSICNLPRTLPVKIPALEHCFGPWTYLTPAGTPLPDGIVRRNCEVCGTEQRENVRNIDQSLLPEAPTDATDPGPDGAKPDEQPEKPAKLDAVILVILVIAVVAACFVGVEVYLMRKKKKVKQT